MKKILEHVTTYFAAVAYAEEGDFETVYTLINKKRLIEKRPEQQKRPLARMAAPRSM